MLAKTANYKTGLQNLEIMQNIIWHPDLIDAPENNIGGGSRLDISCGSVSGMVTSVVPSYVLKNSDSVLLNVNWQEGYNEIGTSKTMDLTVQAQDHTTGNLISYTFPMTLTNQVPTITTKLVDSNNAAVGSKLDDSTQYYLVVTVDDEMVESGMDDIGGDISLVPSSGTLAEMITVSASTEITTGGSREIRFPFIVNPSAIDKSILVSFEDEAGGAGTSSQLFAFEHNTSPTISIVPHVTVASTEYDTIGDILSENVKTYDDSYRYICFNASNNGSGNNIDIGINILSDGDEKFYQPDISYYCEMLSQWQAFSTGNFLEGESTDSGILRFKLAHDWNGNVEVAITVTDHDFGNQSEAIKIFLVDDAASTPYLKQA